MHMFGTIPNAPAHRVTMRWPRVQEFVHVFCYMSLSIFIATSARSRNRRPYRHESAALDARMAPWPIDAYRKHYEHTSLASEDATRGSISESSKRVG